MEEKLLAVISERMGEAVHIAWMEKRAKERGWHNPADCKIPNSTSNPKFTIKDSVKCYCSQCHPCMRPYKELPDNEKELPRKYPKLFFSILEEMGYTFVKITHKTE